MVVLPGLQSVLIGGAWRRVLRPRRHRPPRPVTSFFKEWGLWQGCRSPRWKQDWPIGPGRRDQTRSTHKVHAQSARTNHRHCPEQFSQRRGRVAEGRGDDSASLRALRPRRAPAGDRRSFEAAESNRPRLGLPSGDDAPRQCVSAVWRRASASMARATPLRRLGPRR
jgi:hypothetical protein